MIVLLAAIVGGLSGFSRYRGSDDRQKRRLPLGSNRIR
jgi:hypothetical protein